MPSFCYQYYLVLSACPIIHYHISMSAGQLSAVVALHHSKAQVAATAVSRTGEGEVCCGWAVGTGCVVGVAGLLLSRC